VLCFKESSPRRAGHYLLLERVLLKRTAEALHVEDFKIAGLSISLAVEINQKSLIVAESNFERECAALVFLKTEKSIKR
jgi:hypothetical protein